MFIFWTIQFKTQPARSQNYSQYYYDKHICFAKSCIHSHRSLYCTFSNTTKTLLSSFVRPKMDINLYIL